MHANIYIDAFNLYYGALKGTSFRWLDLRALAQEILGSGFELHHIRYFTAPIKAQSRDPQKHIRQQTYFRALRTLQALSIHEGHFLSNSVLMPRANPRRGESPLVEVIRTEEKGSDANLAAYLTRDAAKRDSQAAFVITGDSDFAGVIRMVRQDFNFPVHVVDPTGSVSRRLRNAATSYQLLGGALLPACQFPATLSDDKGTITRPLKWA